MNLTFNKKAVNWIKKWGLRPEKNSKKQSRGSMAVLVVALKNNRHLGFVYFLNPLWQLDTSSTGSTATTTSTYNI